MRGKWRTRTSPPNIGPDPSAPLVPVQCDEVDAKPRRGLVVQSGERVRGHANDRAIMDNWPGGNPRPEAAHIVGSEDRWLMTAMNTVHRVVGGGDQWWADGKISYPDGSTWFIVVLLQLRAAMVHRETWYFGPPVEAPAWRDAWVERMD